LSNHERISGTVSFQQGGDIILTDKS